MGASIAQKGKLRASHRQPAFFGVPLIPAAILAVRRVAAFLYFFGIARFKPHTLKEAWFSTSVGFPMFLLRSAALGLFLPCCARLGMGRAGLRPQAAKPAAVLEGWARGRGWKLWGNGEKQRELRVEVPAHGNIQD